MEPNLANATVDNDEADDRPTLPAGPPFDQATAHFFSTMETQPEIVIDAALLARMTQAASEDEAGAWWAAQRRSMHVRWVALLLAACVALLFAGALR